MKSVPGGGSGRKNPGCLRCSLRRRSVRGRWVGSRRWAGAFAALADLLEFVLHLRQPAAQLGVLRFQLGDPLLEGGDQGQDGGLGLRRDRVPEWCGDRRWRNHTLYYEAFCTESSAGMAPVARKPRTARDEPLNSYRGDLPLISGEAIVILVLTIDERRDSTNDML